MKYVKKTILILGFVLMILIAGCVKTEDNNFLHSDCIESGGHIVQESTGCENNETSLGKVYDVDCICVCCAPKKGEKSNVKYYCDSDSDCIIKGGECGPGCYHKTEEPKINPKIECEYRPWFKQEQCKCIENICKKISCEKLGLNFTECDKEASSEIFSISYDKTTAKINVSLPLNKINVCGLAKETSKTLGLELKECSHIEKDENIWNINGENTKDKLCQLEININEGKKTVLISNVCAMPRS